MFREFLAWFVEADKLFVIIGSKNAITYNHGTYTENNSEHIVSNGIAPRKNYHFKVLCENEIIMITFE